MSDFDEFKSYYALADKLMATMTPEQLADCLRILALHVGDYRLRFGEIPGQDFLALLGLGIGESSVDMTSIAFSQHCYSLAWVWCRAAVVRPMAYGALCKLR